MPAIPACITRWRGERIWCGCQGWCQSLISMRRAGVGDPHLHTHVIVPNRQARVDGQLVSIDGTSLYHEAKDGSDLSGDAAARTEPLDRAGVASGRSVDGDGRGGRDQSRDDSGVVAALQSATRVGGPQSGARRRRAAHAAAAGHGAESHPAQETRGAGVGAVAADVARRCARAAARQRRARRRTCGAHRRISGAV